MRLNRFAFNGLIIAIAAAIAVVYGDGLKALLTTHGIAYILPLALVFAVGCLWIFEWLDKKFNRSADISTTIFYEYYPRPSIHASDWDGPLTAAEATIDAAMSSAKKGQYNTLSIISADKHELIARWEKVGWRIEISDFEMRGSRIALRSTHEAAGSIISKSKWKYVFGKQPRDMLGDTSARAIFLSFLDLGDQPEGIAWATVEIIS